jgi:hypothetical protein
MMDWIRISCASLCRIEHLDRYFLLLNHNRRHKGIYQLSPVGGALTANRSDEIIQRFGATLEDPSSSDLRFSMKIENLPAFSSWFYSGEGRERTPYRELHEELVEEAHLLSALLPEDLDCTYLRTLEEEGLTERGGQTGLLTHYFLEVYDIKFKTGATLGPLLTAPSESGACWVTADVIQQRVTRMTIDGEEREVRVRALPLLTPPLPDHVHNTQGSSGSRAP